MSFKLALSDVSDVSAIANENRWENDSLQRSSFMFRFSGLFDVLEMIDKDLVDLGRF